MDDGRIFIDEQMTKDDKYLQAISTNVIKSVEDIFINKWYYSRLYRKVVGF